MALLHIIEGAIQGTDTWADVGSKIEELAGVGVKKAETAVEIFAEQFLTEFGQQALSLAASAVSQVISGTPIKDVAATITPQITADAISDAEKSGDVVLNALRVQLTAAPLTPAS